MPPVDRRDPRHARRLQTGGGRRSTDFSLEAAVLASDLNLVLSSVVETVADGICIVDRQSRIQFVNRETERILGIPRADMQGHTIAELTPKLVDVEGKPMRKAGRPGVLAMGQNAPVYDVYMGFERPDGSVVDLSVNAAPLRGATAAATGAVLSVRDVTERIRAERELLSSRQRLATLMANAPIVLYAVDMQGRFTFCEGRALKALGIEPGALTNSSATEGPSATRESVKALRSAVNDGPGARQVHVGDVGVDLELRNEPLLDERGEMIGMIGVAVDVTDRNRAEKAAQESLEQLMVVDQARRQLIDRLVSAQEEERRRIAADMHDDSLQILGAISLRLARVRKRASDADIRDAVDEIQSTVELAATRLRHLLFNLRPPVLDREGVAAALREYLEQLRGDVGIHYRLNDRLERQPSLEQGSNLFRMAQEALANVGKHAQASRVDVSLENRRGGTLLTIRDDGRGFNPEGARRPDSLGLLAMSERAEMMGGWCEVQSAKREGTRVRIWVPEVVAEQTA